MSELVRSSEAVPPSTGMVIRLARGLRGEEVDSTPIEIIEDVAEFLLDRWAIWNVGLYDIIMAPSAATEPYATSKPWKCANAGAGCMSEWEPRCTPKASPLDPLLCEQCEAHVGPPFKCAAPDCKTPTAGEARTSRTAMVTCVACFDHEVAAWTDHKQDAAKAGRPRPEPAYVPPGESTMGGSWRSGGAMWRPTGGGR